MKNSIVTRRRFCAISAAATAFPAQSLSHDQAAPQLFHWRGIAMGAGASITLQSNDSNHARATHLAIVQEISRLEDLFSLHRPHSELAQLNRSGRLNAPQPEMLEVFSLSATVHHATGGAFDPTVQSLWQLHAEAAIREQYPSADALRDALHNSGWQYVRFSNDAIYFAKQGLSLTFNGIAQGYIADRVARVLRARGFRDVLVNMGEINALGHRASGTAWQVGIATPDSTERATKLLSDRALATSAPKGTLLDQSGRVGHIIDPRTGVPAGLWQIVSVSAPRAAVADALSTAFCLMTSQEIEETLTAFPTARIEYLA